MLHPYRFAFGMGAFAEYIGAYKTDTFGAKIIPKEVWPMLTILIGTDRTANTDAVLDMIAQDVTEKKPNRILMVPELISHNTERRLSMVAGDTTSRYAEVLTFSRLATRVSDAIGCGLPECMDNGGRIVAMASAVRQLKNKLKAYAALEPRPCMEMGA